MRMNTLNRSQDQVLFINLKDAHDFRVTLNDLYITLRQRLSHLHIKQI